MLWARESTTWPCAPRRGAGVRTLLEAGLGCALLMVFARLLQVTGSGMGSTVANLSLFLSLFWLVAWPAWRLRPIRRQLWWVRIGLGLSRAVAVLAIGLSVCNVWLQTLGRGGYPPESIHDPLFAFSLPGFWNDHLPLSLGSILLAPTGVSTSKASLIPLLLLLAGWTAYCRRSSRPSAAPETG